MKKLITLAAMVMLSGCAATYGNGVVPDMPPINYKNDPQVRACTNEATKRVSKTPNFYCHSTGYGQYSGVSCREGRSYRNVFSAEVYYRCMSKEGAIK